MAAFTHVNPLGSRFRHGSNGVFYAARERATAVAETRHHHARFLAATRQGAMHLPMRLYHVAIDARLHDLRPPGAVDAAVYDPDDYAASQALGARLHAAGSAGVVYRSVRHERGSASGCSGRAAPAAACTPPTCCTPGTAQRFTDVYEKTEMSRLAAALRPSPLRPPRRCAARRGDRLDGGIPLLLRPQPATACCIRAQDFYRDPFWTWQRTCIVTLFLLCAGIGQAVALDARPALAALLAPLGAGGRLRGAGQPSARR